MRARQQRAGRLPPQHIVDRLRRKAGRSGSTGRPRSARPRAGRETRRCARASSFQAGRAANRAVPGSSSRTSPTGRTLARLYTMASQRYPCSSFAARERRWPMDDYIDPAMLELDDGLPSASRCRAREDPVLLRGEGHYADDVSLPGQAYAVMVRSHYRPRGDPRHRHRGGARHAGRARGLHRGRSGGGRDRPVAAAPGHEQSRRHADAEPGPPCAGRPTRCGMSARRSPR